MLVNHDLKMLFIHNPKCVGIALTQWLMEQYGFEQFRESNNPCPDCPVVEGHRYVIPFDLKSYEVITSAREPFQRWKSCYLYYALVLGVEQSFADFTCDRIICLPPQVEYTRRADYILRFDQLAEDAGRLPFVDGSPEIPRHNVTQDRERHNEVRDSIIWTDELRSLVANHFWDDIAMWKNISN